MAVYERIVREDDTDVEAHWGCALSRFGIEYVEDPTTYEWIPTCHRVSFDSFLEDVVYMKMKDDVSFLLGTSLSQYEHQSTFNPNMPLRGFLYFANLYRTLIKGNERIYSKYRVVIPNPKHIVFYNGKLSEMNGDCVKLKLSDAFEEPDDSGEFEWTATMININAGHSKEIMENVGC